jgi:CHRD domain-containing protein
MRARIVGIAFVVGLIGAGVAVAGANRNWSTHAQGGQEVPAHDTNAQAQAIFHLSKDGTALDYKLIVSNIENVVQAHIHQGPAGSNGPIGVFLYGLVPPGGGRTDGVLAEGTITAGNFIGPFAGKTVEQVAELLDSGGAYVNVHTNDGVAPVDTGPGDFPGGEVRGQIK